MFTLHFTTDNDAFHPNVRLEVMAILREIIGKIDEGADAGKCIDSNGNTVGAWELDHEAE